MGTIVPPRSSVKEITSALAIPSGVGMHVAGRRVQTDSVPLHWLAGATSVRLALVAVAVVGVAIRVFHLNQAMRLDEARTFLDYAIRPLPDAISNYNIPNNHLLHTLLVWTSIRIFGHAEWAIRLPAFVAGLLVMPATYVATRALADRSAALAATALAAVLPVLVLYSTNARGYSMVCLAFVVLIVVADRLAAEESAARWAAFGAIVALGAATIPVMLYPAGAAALWLCAERVRRHGWRRAPAFAARLAAVLALAGALAALAYVPAIQRFGVGSIVGNKFVSPYRWPQFLHALPQFARRLRGTIGLGIPNAALLPLVLLGLAPLATRGRERGKLVTLALATGLWCIALLVATRRAPPPRVWLFLAPLCCLYAGIGLARFATWASPRFGSEAQPFLAALSALVVAAIATSTVVRRTVLEDNESVLLVAGPDIARSLLAVARPDDRLIVSNMVSPEVDYYLYTMAGRRFGDLEAPSRSRRLLLVLNHREAQTPATVRTERPDVDWGRYQSPTPLRRFHSASLWAAARRE